MKRWISLMLLCSFLVLAAASASADLRRGSEGEEVVALQQKLIDIGALNDAADGKFGRKTEQAVKDMQAYWGMNKSGKAGQAFLDKLDLMWIALCESNPDSAPEKDAGRYVSCLPTEKTGVYEYCPRHGIIPELQGMLKNNGRKAPEGVRIVICGRIAEAAYAATVAMYDVWESRLKSSEKPIARKYREEFEEGYAEKSADLLDYYQRKPLTAYSQLADWVVGLMVQECYDLYGMEPNTGD